MPRGRGAIYIPAATKEPPALAAAQEEGCVVADRIRGVLSCVVRRWELIKAENLAESSAGTRGKAARSEDDGDVEMPDERRVTSMAMSATAQ